MGGPSPPLSGTQDGTDIRAYYAATTFFNAAVAKSLAGATMQAITSWNFKFLDSQDESTQWADRKKLWAKFVEACEAKQEARGRLSSQRQSCGRLGSHSWSCGRLISHVMRATWQPGPAGDLAAMPCGRQRFRVAIRSRDAQS